jgi:hypothetical protein
MLLYSFIPGHFQLYSRWRNCTAFFPVVLLYSFIPSDFPALLAAFSATWSVLLLKNRHAHFELNWARWSGLYMRRRFGTHDIPPLVGGK